MNQVKDLSIKHNRARVEEMCKLADFIGNRIYDRKGDTHLPWVATREGEDNYNKNRKLRSYLFTIYRLNQIEGTISNFEGHPLSAWRVLPVFSDLIIPESVKLEEGIYEQVDLLDRSDFNIEPKDCEYVITRQVKDNEGKVSEETVTVQSCAVMSLDEFNALTSQVQTRFRLSSNDITTFDKCRVNKTLGDTNIKGRIAFLNKSPFNKVYPLKLNFNFYKNDECGYTYDNVLKNHIRSQVESKYPNLGNSNSNQ